MDLRYALLDSHHILRTTTNLSLGLPNEHYLTDLSRYRWIRCCNYIVELCASRFGPDYLSWLHFGSSTRILGHYWRDFRYSVETFDYWLWARDVLYR